MATQKQILLVASIRAEAEKKIAAAKKYSEERAAMGKNGHATRMNEAIQNLETWLARDENNVANGGVSVWITGTLPCLNSQWLECVPK